MKDDAIEDKQDIRQWWATNPMTYADTHGQTSYADGTTATLGQRQFFEAADATFEEWNSPLHNERKFGKLFDYDRYRGKKVLEVGCGMGAMAMHWAKAGANIHAIDLNSTSIEQTTTRFALNNLTGHIALGDGNQLDFPDDHFDYVYSWGVLHHSPDLKRSIKELLRVLKPGGGFGVMLYNRESLSCRYFTDFVEGFLHREDAFLSPIELASRYGDGAREEGNPHTWPVTIDEMDGLFSPRSDDLDIKVLGGDLDFVFRYLMPGIGQVLPVFAKKVWARRFGLSLWMNGHLSR